MHLTTFSDYAFRILIYLSVRKVPCSLNEISKAYGISRNHLIKAVNVLEKNSFIHTKRGVGGGISLAKPASEIGLAEVVKCTEPSFTIVECFDREKNKCVITSACKLKHLLADALNAFLNELAGHTLADISANSKDVLNLLVLDTPSEK
jgi:Rrf2 family transcriptional regulator, nitric oxide-sensitive transcriptional repressor